MKQVLLALFLLGSFYCLGQKWEIKTKIINGEKYFVYPEPFDLLDSYPSQCFIWAAKSKSRKLQDGKWVRYFKQDSVKIAAIMELKNRKLNGRVMEFNFNGIKITDRIYDFDEEIQFTKWYDNGNLLSMGQNKSLRFDNHTFYFPIGIWKEWFENGGIKSIRTYSDKSARLSQFKNFKDLITDNNREGLQVEYYENGNRKSEEFYRNDKLDSTQTFWHPNGQIEKQLKYIKGEFIPKNPTTFYYSSGKKRETGDLIKGRRIGQWISFYETSEVKSKGNYDTLSFYLGEYFGGAYNIINVKIGKWEYFYTNGKIMAEGDYQIVGIECKKMDNWKYWDEDGNSTFEYRLKNDITEEK